MADHFDGVRWVEPTRLHITLRFIGETTMPKSIDDALAAVRSPAFELNLLGVGCFPEDMLKPPRVLWAGTSQPAALFALVRAIDAALAPLGIPSDPKPFSPHITLARIPRPNRDTIDHVGEFLKSNRGFVSDPFPVTAFTLYQSTRRPTGQVYTPLNRYPLVRQ